MFKKSTIKGFIAGIIFSLLCTSVSISFAEPIKRLIEVVYTNSKVYVDGNLTILRDAQGNKIEPFAFNGTNYLPARGLAEALGENVTWDSKSNSIFIGKAPDGQNMVDILKPYFVSEAKCEVKDLMKMGGKNYYKGYTISSADILTAIYKDGVSTPYFRDGLIAFNLDGNYNSITGIMGFEDSASSVLKSELQIYGDGNIIAAYSLSGENLPQPFEWDVRGVLKLEIKSTYTSGQVNLANLKIK